MTFATFLTAATGYALLYAAMPSRTALRARTRAMTTRLLGAGVVMLVISAVLGAIAFGPVIGLAVAIATAAAAGSLLVLLGPSVMSRNRAFIARGPSEGEGRRSRP